MFTGVLIAVLIGSTLGCFSWGCWLWISHVELEMDIANERDEVKRLEHSAQKLREQRDDYRVKLLGVETELCRTRKLLAESVARENRVRLALNHEGWE